MTIQTKILIVAVILILIGQGILIWQLRPRPSQTNEVILNRIDSLMIEVEDSKKVIDDLNAKILTFGDTITKIQTLRTINHENYYIDYAGLVANDSTERALQYRSDFRDALRHIGTGHEIYYPR